MAKWGIQVPFPDWEHWLWVTEDGAITASWAESDIGDLKPLSFDTEQKAQKHGRAWKTFHVARITE